PASSKSGVALRLPPQSKTSRKCSRQLIISNFHMRYIEPHAHMVSRVTDDYVAMITAGCQAVCEPAFWAGFDRSSVHGFYDYFCQLTDYEPKRAAKHGLPHFSWLCINPKEAEDMVLGQEVLD